MIYGGIQMARQARDQRNEQNAHEMVKAINAKIKSCDADLQREGQQIISIVEYPNRDAYDSNQP